MLLSSPAQRSPRPGCLAHLHTTLLHSVCAHPSPRTYRTVVTQHRRAGNLALQLLRFLKYQILLKSKCWGRKLPSQPKIPFQWEQDGAQRRSAPSPRQAGSLFEEKPYHRTNPHGNPHTFFNLLALQPHLL